MRGASVLGAVLAAAAVGAGGFALGRDAGKGSAIPARPAPASVPAGTASASPGGSAGSGSAAYLAGLRAGEAQGLREGRALQETAALPTAAAAAARAAFRDGYAAGADDVFTGYDGGWALGVPYAVVLGRGAGGVTYRIADRTALQPGVTYRLCDGGHGLCPQH